MSLLGICEVNLMIFSAQPLLLQQLPIEKKQLGWIE